MLTTDLPVL